MRRVYGSVNPGRWSLPQFSSSLRTRSEALGTQWPQVKEPWTGPDSHQPWGASREEAGKHTTGRAQGRHGTLFKSVSHSRGGWAEAPGGAGSRVDLSPHLPAPAFVFAFSVIKQLWLLLNTFEQGCGTWTFYVWMES